jgi:hypothetical protein
LAKTDWIWLIKDSALTIGDFSIRAKHCQHTAPGHNGIPKRLKRIATGESTTHTYYGYRIIHNVTIILP